MTTKYSLVLVVFELSKRGIKLYAIWGACFLQSVLLTAMLFCPSRGAGCFLDRPWEVAGSVAEGREADLLLGGGGVGSTKCAAPPRRPPLPPSPHLGSEQSLSTRSPASTWAYVQQLKVIDNQRELSRLSRELEP